MRLPDGVELVDGTGGLPAVRVATPAAEALVYLHGAQVTHWTPAGHEPVLWVSEHSAYDPQDAIRGGVPLSFPWFGPGRSGDRTPAHGFARLTRWHLRAAHAEDGAVTLTMQLTDRDVTGWTQPFEATTTVRVGQELRCGLEVRNTGSAPWTYEAALHSYLAVGDVRAVRVTGLAGSRYLDKLSGSGHRQDGDLVLTGPTDRVYTSVGPVTVHDPELDRSITVTTDGAADVVVWNPWAEKAAAMTHFGAEEWTGMVCIEPADVLDDAVDLAPGARHILRATYTVASTW